MNSDVEKLWELQKLLNELNDREKKMAVKPESFADLDLQYQQSAEEMQQISSEIEKLSKERRRVEGELSDQQELLKKYQGQLMQVKNQQQYAAAWKEIDSSRRTVKELEDATMQQMSEIDSLQNQLDEGKESFSSLEKQHQEAYEQWQSSLSELRSESEALRKKMAQIESTIPERLKQEFYRIARQRQNVGIVPVVNESCTGCRTKIRAQVMQQLKRGELVFCEGCRRILYLDKPVAQSA